MGFLNDCREVIATVGASIGVPLELDQSGVLNSSFGEDKRTFSLFVVEQDRTVILVAVVAAFPDGFQDAVLQIAHRFNRESDNRDDGTIGVVADSNELVYSRAVWFDIIDEKTFSAELNHFLSKMLVIRDGFADISRRLVVPAGVSGAQ